MINFEWIEYPLKAHRSNYLFLSSIIKGIEITKLFFHWHYDRLRELSLSYIIPCFEALLCSLFGATYTKIGTIQRRLAWPLRKDDTQNREAFHIFLQPDNRIIRICELPLSIILDLLQIISIYTSTFWNLSWGCRFKSPRLYIIIYK